jgi:hypothetical protein
MCESRSVLASSQGTAWLKKGTQLNKNRGRPQAASVGLENRLTTGANPGAAIGLVGGPIGVVSGATVPEQHLDIGLWLESKRYSGAGIAPARPQHNER